MLLTQRNMIALRKVSPGTFSRISGLSPKHNLISPLSIALARQTRTQHTTSQQPKITTLKPIEGQKILNSQRLLRPVAPHLAIYKWQITSVLSSLERITGIMLSGTLYVFCLAYLASVVPAIPFSLDLSSASIAAAFGAWPIAAKLATKFLVALPFTLHSFNGVRYLIWDLGLQMAKKQVVTTGLVVVFLSFTSAGYLAWM